LKAAQKIVGPAAYFRETFNKLHYEIYLKDSEFLPYINNEKEHEL